MPHLDVTVPCGEERLPKGTRRAGSDRPPLTDLLVKETLRRIELNHVPPTPMVQHVAEPTRMRRLRQDEQGSHRAL
ncbi:hypothetical protein WDA79_03170 [Streptomyces sp. A475]|uniref:hypothetical protein n=1 Tax=Streptomyces sp. A475 TaxID=3131976 RepID=UPI0030C9C7B9